MIRGYAEVLNRIAELLIMLTSTKPCPNYCASLDILKGGLANSLLLKNVFFFFSNKHGIVVV
jgi:hypothetical protein